MEEAGPWMLLCVCSMFLSAQSVLDQEALALGLSSQPSAVRRVRTHI